jgi:hypothetical protein
MKGHPLQEVRVSDAVEIYRIASLYLGWRDQRQGGDYGALLRSRDINIALNDHFVHKNNHIEQKIAQSVWGVTQKYTR